MTRFVVQARRFAGTLAAPTRNDGERAEATDYEEAVRIAERYSQGGASVWLYIDHAPTAPAHGFDPTPPPQLHVVAEWRPGGQRVR